MFLREQNSAVSRPAAHLAMHESGSLRSIFVRYAVQRPGFLAASIVTGLVVGIAYRHLIDVEAERELANYVRSGLHGVGIALAAWTVQAWFAANARSYLGLALRRLPVSGEILVRSLVMTATLIIVGVSLQLALYEEPLPKGWLAATLPRIIAMGFAISLVVGVTTETSRLIGGPVLKSIVLGTYHRPACERLIVMFLDIAGSTRLAEDMGELRVHDLITRFFFDIDEPISDHGGAVHAYVGDEVIVTWPVTLDPRRNARCLACFFAIERRMARLAFDYEREFEIVPSFRAGLHTGPVIVSECGDAKRQLAYFGDTMNVAARLCEYCKAVNRRLILSGELLDQIAVPADLEVDDGKSIPLRGRRKRIEVHAIERARIG
jgi:class 3 adenylate cyclase